MIAAGSVLVHEFDLVRVEVRLPVAKMRGVLVDGAKLEPKRAGNVFRSLPVLHHSVDLRALLWVRLFHFFKSVSLIPSAIACVRRSRK